MELHELKAPTGAKKTRKRVGRGPGSGTGKTSGRGHKGQKARSGYARRPAFEGGQMPLNRRLPKRGFHHANRYERAIVNLDALERVFEAGAEVTPAVLVESGLVKARPGGVKVLGRGELTKKLTVRAHAFSPSARKKIEAVGGTVEFVETPGKKTGEALVPAAESAESEEER